MQTLYTTLYILVTLVILGGLFFSFRYRARQKSELDHSGIDPSIRKNPVYLNPVFWAYILFAAVFLGLIWGYKIYYKAPF